MPQLFDLKYTEYYELILESFFVNGQDFPIDSSVFIGQRTFVDSGTTLAYLADGSFDPFIDGVILVIYLNYS